MESSDIMSKKQNAENELPRISEVYKKSIFEMLSQINDERFLCQIWTILKRHMERKGNISNGL